MNKNYQISIITTGGTIEKEYDEAQGILENKSENRGALIKKRISAKLRLPSTEIEVHSIMHKDSLTMNDDDRELIFKTVEFFSQTKKTPVVVIHGTDTMVQSALVCFEKLKNLTIPVIFTGAMSPLGFEDSDATQNITEALLAAKLLPPGVYIAFHNQIFPLPHVQKNHQKRTFEKVI